MVLKSSAKGQRKLPKKTKVQALASGLLELQTVWNTHIVPLIDGLSDIQTLVRRNIIVLSITTRKLGITDEEIRLETERLVHSSKENTERRRIQSENPRSDVNCSINGQPELLDAESSGDDTVSRAELEGSIIDAGESNSAAGSGEDSD